MTSFKPALEPLDRRDLAAPFGGQIVVINVPPGIPYRVWVPLFPPLNIPPNGLTAPQQWLPAKS